MENYLSAARSHHFYKTGRFLRHHEGGACMDLAPSVGTLLAPSMTMGTAVNRPDQACYENGPEKLLRN
jgi:hypothetical protein